VLSQAGLEVVGVSVRGWDTPRPVPAQLLGAKADRVPPAVVAQSSIATQSGGCRVADGS